MKTTHKMPNTHKPMFNHLTKAMITTIKDWAALAPPSGVVMETSDGKQYSGVFTLDDKPICTWKFKPNNALPADAQGCFLVLDETEKSITDVTKGEVFIKEFFNRAFMTELVNELVDVVDYETNVCAFALAENKHFTGKLKMDTDQGRVYFDWSLRYDAGKEAVVAHIGEIEIEKPTLDKINSTVQDMYAAVQSSLKAAAAIDAIEAAIRGYNDRESGNKFTPEINIIDVNRASIERIEGHAEKVDDGSVVEWWVVQTGHGTMGCTEYHDMARPVKGMQSLHALILEGAVLAHMAGAAIVEAKSAAADDFLEEAASTPATVVADIASTLHEDGLKLRAELRSRLADVDSHISDLRDMVIAARVGAMSDVKLVVGQWNLQYVAPIWAVPVVEMPVDVALLTRNDHTADRVAGADGGAAKDVRLTAHNKFVEWLTVGEGKKYEVEPDSRFGAVVKVVYLDLDIDTQYSEAARVAQATDDAGYATDVHQIDELSVDNKFTAVKQPAAASVSPPPAMATALAAAIAAQVSERVHS